MSITNAGVNAAHPQFKGLLLLFRDCSVKSVSADDRDNDVGGGDVIAHQAQVSKNLLIFESLKLT